MYDLILSFIWAFLLSIFAIPSIINVSHSKKLLDEPNNRNIHVSSTPRLGGLAIFCGFMSALTIFGRMGDGIKHLLAGCLLLFFIGIKDDIISVSVFKKFFVQVLATGIIMFMADIRITSFQGAFGVYDLNIGTSYAFTFLVIVGITNAINLIDGMDGLAGSILLVIAVIFGIYFYRMNSPYAFVAFSFAGGILGFLRYNIFKASIFMGDTGSLVGGFIVSVLAIKFIELRADSASPALAVAILAIPTFDTLKVFAIRIFKGRSPFSPDKNHIHHQLLAIGLSQPMVLLVIISLNIAIVVFVIYFKNLGTNNLLMITASFALMLGLLLAFLQRRNRAYA